MTPPKRSSPSLTLCVSFWVFLKMGALCMRSKRLSSLMIAKSLHYVCYELRLLSSSFKVKIEYRPQLTQVFFPQGVLLEVLTTDRYGSEDNAFARGSPQNPQPSMARKTRKLGQNIPFLLSSCKFGSGQVQE